MKSKGSKKSFELIVGSDIYAVWVKMLEDLVPHGRTHRLAVIVAGMIQYAANVAYKKNADLYEEVFEMTDYDGYDEGNKNLSSYTEKLFTDAKVKSRRSNSKGQSYSIMESALMEYQRWDNMPWE